MHTVRRNFCGFFYFREQKNGDSRKISILYLLSSNYLNRWCFPVETRVALIAVVVENTDSAEKLNAVIHEYGRYIIGRMGIPYEKKNISVISIALDATQDVISSLAGRIGRLDGVSAKTVYSKV